MAENLPSSERFTIKTYAANGKNLYLSENLADFHFIFKSKSGGGHSKRIPVHKFPLASVSDVFQVMFNGSWKEKVDVEIVDASAEAFKEFLQFFYLTEARITSENVAEVMNLGKKYDVTECFNICGEFLNKRLQTNSVHSDDICVIYELASHLEHKQLENQCAEYIERNTGAIFATEGFLGCDRKTIKRILQMDTLYCTETQVFQAFMKWMKAKCGSEELTLQTVQDKFSDLMHEIRFRSMTLSELRALNPPYETLFTPDERSEIVQMIESEEYKPKIFNATRRNVFGPTYFDEKYHLPPRLSFECNRYVGLSKKPYFFNNIETTTFTVNQPVALGAFACSPAYRYDECFDRYLTIDVHTKIELAASIFEIVDSTKSSRKIILFNEKNTTPMKGVTHVYLPKLIIIRPGIKYEIQIEIKLPASENLCSTYMLKREVKPEVMETELPEDIIVQFHNDPIIDNEARGLVYMLKFNKM